MVLSSDKPIYGNTETSTCLTESTVWSPAGFKENCHSPATAVKSNQAESLDDAEPHLQCCSIAAESRLVGQVSRFFPVFASGFCMIITRSVGCNYCMTAMNAPIAPAVAHAPDLCS